MSDGFIPAYKDNKQVYVVEIPTRPDDEDEFSEEDQPELFARQPGENDYDFYCFTVYRDLEPSVRTVRAAARKVDVALDGLYVKANKWNWVKRAEAWDDECDRVARETQLDVIKEMNERHARNSANLQSMLMLPAGILSNKIKQNGGVAAFENMTMEDLFNIIVKVAHAYPNIAKLERTAKGEAEEIKKSEVTIDANVNINEVKYNVVRTETIKEMADSQASDNA